MLRTGRRLGCSFTISMAAKIWSMKNSGPVSREAANVAVGDRNRKRRALHIGVLAQPVRVRYPIEVVAVE